MNKPFAPLSREEIAIRALGLRRDPLAGELIALEPRMVFDGAGLAVATDAAKQAADASDAGKAGTSGKSTTDAAAELAKTIAEAAVPPAQPAPRPVEVVFIDSRVADIDAFKKTAGDSRVVVVVDAKDDGFAKITQTLSSLHDVSAVHIVGHGTDGAFELGKDWIGVDAVKAHEAEIKSWQSALAHGADILLYGCEVAKTAKGDELIKVLAAESGADVAASRDAVGHTDHGADWSLEKTTGTIEAKTLAPEGYAYELAVSASVQANGLIDDARPLFSYSGGYVILRGGTYTAAVAAQNVTNDLQPAIRGAGTLGATVNLYLYSADGTTKQLVGTSNVTTVSGFNVFTVTYGKDKNGAAIAGVPTLAYGSAFKFATTQIEPGNTESLISDAEQFWVAFDNTSPTQYTANDTGVFKDGSGNAIAGNAITFNAYSTTTATNLVRIYLTDQQALDCGITRSGTTTTGNVTIRAVYLDNAGAWARATTSIVYRAAMGVKWDATASKYYAQIDPTDWFAKDSASHNETNRIYFFLGDGAGNFTDAKGNAATTATIKGETLDVPVSVENALYLDVSYRVTKMPVIAGFSDDYGTTQSVGTALLGNNAVTDDTTPTFQVTNMEPGATLTLVLNRIDATGKSVAIAVTPNIITDPSLPSDTYKFTLSKELEVGYNYTLSVKQTSGGLDSNLTSPFTFKIDRNTPDFTFVDNFGAVQNSDLSSTGAYSLVDAVTLSGTTKKAFGSTLTLDLTITPYSQTSSTATPTAQQSIIKMGLTVNVKSDGSWTYVIPNFDSNGNKLLGNGLNAISATVRDSNGASVTKTSSIVYVSSAWTPGGLGTNGLAVWYDPSIDGAYKLVDGTNYVSDLYDLSGNGMNAKQATTALQPIITTNAAGYKVIKFVADWWPAP